MGAIALSPLDLSIAAMLVLILAASSAWLQLGFGRQVLIASVRTTIQLLLVGHVLRLLFTDVNLFWIAGISVIMFAVAVWEATARQQRRLKGWRSYGINALAIFISTFTIIIFSLLIIINEQPWYSPQYAIPLLGMMLGNCMTSVAISIDRLTQSLWKERSIIEQRLLLGESKSQATLELRKASVNAGMIPIINVMMTAGIVSLPGMMTGQILAGAPPVEAVKYQILLMFLITVVTGAGVMIAVWLTLRNLFDKRDRLNLQKLTMNS